MSMAIGAILRGAAGARGGGFGASQIPASGWFPGADKKLKSILDRRRANELEKEYFRAPMKGEKGYKPAPIKVRPPEDKTFTSFHMAPEEPREEVPYPFPFPLSYPNPHGETRRQSPFKVPRR